MQSSLSLVAATISRCSSSRSLLIGISSPRANKHFAFSSSVSSACRQYNSQSSTKSCSSTVLVLGSCEKRGNNNLLLTTTMKKSKLSSSFKSVLQFAKRYSSSNTLTKKLSTTATPMTKSMATTTITTTTPTTTPTTPTSEMKVVESSDHVICADQDQRLYRGIRLPNGMKCLLISDPQTDRSAASVDVHVGHLLDPAQFSGLAHFCEHMIFMGSKKYPQENKFSKFIEEHAGMTNAFTSTENTNYHFEVATESFKEALDIFAQFFISPLFDKSSVDREINAVDSENQKNLQSDLWRLNQLEKSTCRTDHPYSKYGTGNLQTLKIEPEKLGLNVRDELIKFHHKYYSANLMSLSMLGKESLDELQNYAVEMFSAIPNKNLKPIEFDPNPFRSESLPSIYYVVPVQDLRQLSINWIIPDYSDQYESSPQNYLSHLLGHEGSGSLLSELKRRGWSNQIFVGARREARGFQMFNLTADLSEEGEENVEEILALVYQYLNMIKNEKPTMWIFDEMNDLGKLTFNFKDKEKPISYVSAIASDLHMYSLDRVLSAKYYSTKFDSNLIESLFDYLVPSKMKVFVLSKKYEGKTDQIEKWYGTEYKCEKLSVESLNKLNAANLSVESFKLPLKNEFIPKDLSLVKHEHEIKTPDDELKYKYPRLIRNDKLGRVWYKEDDKFKLPKAVVKIELRNPLAYFDPVHVNMNGLYVELVKDALTEYSYAATLAGLSYSISPTNYGLLIQLEGFNDKMNVLLHTIVDHMTNLKINEQRYNILKECHQRNLLNFEAEQPFQHSIYYMNHLLSERGWTKQQMLDSLEHFSAEDVQTFIPRMLTQGIFVESIVHGNVTEQNALELAELVLENLKQAAVLKSLRPLEPAHMNNLRQFQLPNRISHIFLRNNQVHKTVGVEAYYQCGPQSTRTNALIEFFCQIINESCFNVLRTKEQLGYIVASGVRSFGGVVGVRVIVQSDRLPSYLDERIENFIKITRDNLNEMDDDHFKQHMNALILTKIEEPKRLSQQCEIYWSEITDRQYDFDRQNVEVEELKKLSKADVIDFYNRLIAEDGPERRKLAVYICPPEMNADLQQSDEKETKLKGELIESIDEWRLLHPLYPLPKSTKKL